MFEEKSGVEVLIIGKRLIIYDHDANVVDEEKLINYAWKVEEK